MRDDRERLLDIIEAIKKIEKYADIDREVFDKDELVQTWMSHYILIIGEAVANLSEELRTNNPEIPWREIITMRNILVHVYFHVEYDEVWNVIEQDIPRLKNQILAILKNNQ